MKKSRLLFIGLALIAGVIAWMLTGNDTPQPVVVEQNNQPAPQIENEEVLIASHNIEVGIQITGDDISWVKWPKANVLDSMIVRSRTPDAVNDIKGTITRSPIYEGEPLRREKLVKAKNSGYLAAILPEGYRAMSINIDSGGSTSVGGFVLPNDRVDILMVGQDDEGRAGNNLSAQTIMQNVRVLAIGQNIQEKNGEKVVIGSTATLEVTPRQAEILTLSQRVGQLSLVLRSIEERKDGDVKMVDKERTTSPLTIIRFGVASSVGKR
jgi:pilus assembly protein CpaB